MGCIGCSCSTGKDSVSGCRSNGGCSTGGCNRHNTYDWITALGIADSKPFDVVEVSFKNGSRKEFFKNPPFTRITTGDWVLVESYSGGYDVGKVSLSGELVRLQMKRKRVRNNAKLGSLIRKAHERDIERLDEVRRQERDVMIKARVIARTLDLDMKVGDVEFQGDGRKCTFYYTADGRVDFRELIRHYAREFKVKIEMRQIGARQESARIGGIGNCGRELCCSTWLTEFKSVNTAAARYQNLAINQTKLSGMCGRLKCCLNYELDAYIDALEDFPDKADRLKTEAGLAVLMKTDVFKRMMFYAYADNKGRFFPLHVDQVWEAIDMIKQGQPPASLEEILNFSTSASANEDEEVEETFDYEAVDNVVQLPLEKRKKKKKKKKNRDRSAAAALENAPPPPLEGNRQQSRPQGQQQRRPDAGAQQRPQGQQQRPNRPDQRPPRPEGQERNPNRPPQQGGQKPEQRPNRPDQRPPRPEGQERNSNRPPQQDGGQKPEQRQNRPDQRPPRPEGQERNPNRPPEQRKDGQPKPPGQKPGGNPQNPNRKPDDRNKNKENIPPKKEE